MTVACILVGAVLSIIGLYVKSELKENAVDVSLGSVVAFALISFVVGILIVVGKIWAVCFLFPYLIVQFNANKRYQDEYAVKVTLCEFCVGTGVGLSLILAIILIGVLYMFNHREK